MSTESDRGVGLRLAGTTESIETPLQAELRRIVENIYGAPVRALPGLEIGRAYRSATNEFRYGGDMVDAFQYSDGSVSLSVVDITGHGLRAATYASLVKYALRAYASRNLSALDSVRSLNRLCIENSAFEADNEFFATAFFAKLAPDRKTLEYVSAGHEAAYVFHNGKPTILHATGPIVGLVDDELGFEHVSMALAPDDILVAVTDGFSESRDAEGTFLGPEALVDVVLANRPLSAEGQAEAITRHAFEYGNGLRDDVAALVVKITAP